MSTVQRRGSVLALAGAIEPVWFLGASLVFGALRPGYSFNHAISELGQQGSNLAIAWNVIGFGGAALLYLVYAAAISREFGRGWLFWLTMGQAVAIAASGTFSCDPGCPQMMVTPVGWGHTVAGLTYFSIVVVLPGFAAWEFRHRAEWRSLKVPSVATSLVLVVLFAAGPTVFGAAHIGLWQRSTLLIAGAWTMLVALRLRAALRHDEREMRAAETVIAKPRGAA